MNSGTCAAGHFYSIALIINIFVASMYSIAVVGFIFGVPVNVYYFYAALLACAIFVWRMCVHGLCSHAFLGSESHVPAPSSPPGISSPPPPPCIRIRILNDIRASRPHPGRHSLPTGQDGFVFLISLALVVVFSLVCSWLFWDSSGDGRGYHQIGTIFIRYGYNPIYDRMKDMVELSRFYSYDLWVTHYVKFGEIMWALFHTFTNSIELAKSFSYLYTISTICMCAVVLSKYFSPWLSLFFATVLTCSPVLISQINTYEVDFLISLSLSHVLCSIVLVHRGSRSRALYFILVANAVFCCNVKFTGAVFVSIIGAFVLLFYVFGGRDRDKFRLFCKLGAVSALLCVLAGINPYITNIVHGKHVFYPLIGSSSVDINRVQQAPGFYSLSLPRKLFIGLFAKTQNITIGDFVLREPEMKIPFSLHDDEENYNVADMRMGGFGHFFSGAFVLSMIILMRVRDSRIFWALVAMLCCILVVIDGWWARYVPQWYFLSVVLALFGIARLSGFYRIVGWGVILILCVNSINPLVYSYGRALYFHMVQGATISLARQFSVSQELRIYAPRKFGELSFMQKLDESGIAYTLVDSPNGLHKVPCNAQPGMKWNIEDPIMCEVDKTSLKRMGFVQSVRSLLSCFSSD